ncbi:hypothetical protein EV715DRAFT_212519 [Schizophyllum commune]
MPTLTISTGLQYAYTDSGPPENASSYSTLFFIHGYAFYSTAHDTSSLPPTSAGRRSSAFTRTGICERLLPVASNQGIRLVCINRRAYPDSTPFSEDEQRIFRSGSDDERKALLRAEGEDLALLIDALIVELGLPERVTILAWSMGNVYLLSLLASIRRLPGEIAQRLRTHVTSFILWDPPDEALGYDRPHIYTPFTDENVPLDQRGVAFVRWLGNYWTHDHAPRDPLRLSACSSSEGPPPTTDRMSPAEFTDLTDFAAASTCDNWVVHPKLMHLIADLREEALCDPKVMAEWQQPRIHYLWTEHAPWMVWWAKWCIEDDLASRREEMPGIQFRMMQGCNHFSQWDAPEVTLEAFRRCMS